MVAQSTLGSNSDSQHRRTPIAAIDDLSDDPLLEIFHYCRPIISDEDIVGIKWNDECWWYKIAHVCRRWRQLLLASASHLNICLVCTYTTPVVDMLAHSPSLSIVIDYGDEEREVTRQDEEGILLALRHRHQVCHIRLCMPISSIRRLVVGLDGEFPMLRHLYLSPLISDDSGLSFPSTFKAPHLHHFILRNATYNSAGTFYPPPLSSSIQPIEKFSESTQCSGHQLWRLPRIFIHTLDDDSLLSIFYFCQPAPLNVHDVERAPFLRKEPAKTWVCERWWYKLAQVCRRWRYLILASASYLRLSLLCTHGTPVTDMLTHSPCLPLIIDHLDSAGAEEQGIMLALQLRDRVRRIRLKVYFTDLQLQNLMEALDGEFPMLEYLYIIPLKRDNLGFILSNTFQAPRLRQLILYNPSGSILSPLLMIAVDLVALSLRNIHHNELRRLLSLLPRLETLDITQKRGYLLPIHDVETQMLDAPIITRVTLPHLCVFAFGGDAAYLEALLPGITAPLLERLEIWFFHKFHFSVPHLLQFMGAIENLRFSRAKFQFQRNGAFVEVHPYQGATMFNFSLVVRHKDFDLQLNSAAEIFYSLRMTFSTMEHLALEIQWRQRSWLSITIPTHTQWRELLRPFNNVKTLHVDVDDEFGGELSRSLLAEDGESAVETLPELEVLEYNAARRISGNVFDAFIDARNRAGRTVTLVTL